MLRARDLKHLVQCSITGWIDDGAPSMGASLAFYTLFSLTPLLLVVVALAGLFVGRDAAQNMLIEQIAQVTGDKAAYGIEALLDAAGSRDQGIFAAAAGIFTLVLGATTVFAELTADLNRIWRHKPAKSGGARKFIRTRVVAFGLVVFTGMLLIASVAGTAFLAAMGRRWFPDTELVAHLGEFAISFVILGGLFAMIYKLLPACPIEWRDVWVGAGVTSVLFWIGKLLISFYIAKAAVGSTFGAAGAIVVVIAWVYYSAQVFFLGAEFTRQYALRHGSKKDAPTDRRRTPYVVSSDRKLVERAEKIVRGTDPVLERSRKRA